MSDARPTADGLLRAEPRSRFRAVGEDGVLVHLQRGRVSVVNGVGLQIFDWLQEPRSQDELLDLLCAEFEVDRPRAAIDLEVYLGQLTAEGLLLAPEAGDA